MKLVKPTPSNNYVRGWKVNPRHSGIDYGWQISRLVESRKVLAAAPGTVVATQDGGGWNNGWGNSIVIQHAPNVYTRYNHLATNTRKVKVGDKVVAGEHIATMGMTGNSSKGVHLHFELYLGTWTNAYNRVDPAPYFLKALPGTKAPAPKPSVPASTRTDNYHLVLSSLNLRAGRSTDSKILATIPKGTLVSPLERTGNWVKVIYKNKVGYVHDDYITPRYRHVNAKNGLNVRKSPSTAAKVLTTLPDNKKVIVVSVNGKTDSAAWVEIKVGNIKGWVHRAYLD